MKKIIILLLLLYSGTNAIAQSRKTNKHHHAEQRENISQSTGEEIQLWPENIPDGPGPQGSEIVTDKGSVTNVSKPRLIVHRPNNPNGMAVLVISGGGYAHIELGKESTPAADWLQSEGVTTFELVYRLPQEGWQTTNVPFEDAQRAMRIIRKHAHKYGIDPNNIGVLGFSAGGHLAGMIAVDPDKTYYSPVDEIDNLSARPAFAGLIYPVITMMPPFNKTHAKKSILGTDPSEKKESSYSVELLVNSSTPATFLAQAEDDPISPVENSKLMYKALRKANVPAEIHLFKEGGHGWGMGKPGTAVAEWPELFKSWAKTNGFWK